MIGFDIELDGKAIHNTMDVEEAVQEVNSICLKLVIPCHNNVTAFFTKKYSLADDELFKSKVEKRFEM